MLDQNNVFKTSRGQNKTKQTFNTGKANERNTTDSYNCTMLTEKDISME